MNKPSLLRAGFSSLLITLCIIPAFSQLKPANQANDAKTKATNPFSMVAQMVSDSFGAPVKLIEEFIREAKALEKDEGIPATLFIGIAILESTGFTSHLYQNALNPFGMRATKIWNGPTFVMYHEGADAPFRKYDSPRQAVRDFKVFLASRKWFDDALRCPVTDIDCFLKGMSANLQKKEPGYARDPEWANKIRRVIRTYNLESLR